MKYWFHHPKCREYSFGYFSLFCVISVFFNYRVSQNKISFRKISWTCFIWLPNESFLFLFLTPEVLRQEIKKIKIVKYHKANFLGGTMYFYASFYIFLVCQFDPKVVPRSKGHNWNISLIALVLWNILKQQAEKFKSRKMTKMKTF